LFNASKGARNPVPTKKRLLLFGLAAGVVACGALLSTRTPAQEAVSPGSREIAITIDDLLLNGPEIDLDRLKSMTDHLTQTIQSNHVPVVGFVNEIKLHVTGEEDPRIGLLQLWLDRAIDLGNHTYSHFSLQETPLRRFEDDVVRGEEVTSRLLARRGRKLVYFRYPYLQTGPTREVKEGFERFLAERGYTIAPITVDTNDWVFAEIYTTASLRGDRETMQRVADAYPPYVEKMCDFYENLSRELFGREIRQTMLLHANPLNADHLGDVFRVLRKRGYRFISLSAALEDPAYKSPNQYVGPGGVSWLERWAYTRGKKEKIASEPDPPRFIMELYREYTGKRPY
jgi:peptidoglycan-N-acetylglucosamine deacetylase